jgi:hypothetical protein
MLIFAGILEPQCLQHGARQYTRKNNKVVGLKCLVIKLQVERANVLRGCRGSKIVRKRLGDFGIKSTIIHGQFSECRTAVQCLLHALPLRVVHIVVQNKVSQNVGSLYNLQCFGIFAPAEQPQNKSRDFGMAVQLFNNWKHMFGTSSQINGLQ